MHKDTAPLWKGEEYDENSDPQLHHALRSLEGYAIKEGAKVLDLGTGTGNVLVELLKQHSTISAVGTDISPSMIDTAKNKHANFSDRVKWKVSAAQKLPNKYTGQFNNVICTNAWHWFVNQLEVIKEVARCLAPEGTLFIEGSHKIDTQQLPLIFLACIAAAQDTTITLYCPTFKAELIEKTHPGIDADTLISMLNQEGLTVMSVETNTKFSTQFKDENTFKKWLTPIAKAYPSFSGLPTAKLQDQVLSIIIREYLKLSPPNDDGSINYSLANGVRISAKKK